MYMYYAIGREYDMHAHFYFITQNIYIRSAWIVVYTVNKVLWYSGPQPGCHLPNSPWPGNNLPSPAVPGRFGQKHPGIWYIFLQRTPLYIVPDPSILFYPHQVMFDQKRRHLVASVFKLFVITHTTKYVLLCSRCLFASPACLLLCCQLPAINYGWFYLKVRLLTKTKISGR